MRNIVYNLFIILGIAFLVALGLYAHNYTHNKLDSKEKFIISPKSNTYKFKSENNTSNTDITYDIYDHINNNVINNTTFSDDKTKIINAIDQEDINKSNNDTANAIESFYSNNGTNVTEGKDTIKNVPIPKVRHKIQLGAFTSRQDAIDYWDEMVISYPKLFDNLYYFIEKIIIHNKTFYRLHVLPFSSEEQAKRFCTELETKKKDCFFVHN